MTRYPERERALRTIPASPGTDRPAQPERFEPWPPDTKERAFALWSTTAGRSGARVERALAQESEPRVAVPSASSINRWSVEFGWAARADREILQTRNRSLRELRAGLLAAAVLGKDCLLDALSGNLDDLPPGAAAARLKSAEISMRLVERSGLLALLADAPDIEDDESDTSDLSLTARGRLAREKIVRDNRGN